MNQEAAYEKVKDFVKNEVSQCAELSKLIDEMFPAKEEHHVSLFMHGTMKPYLKQRGLAAHMIISIIDAMEDDDNYEKLIYLPGDF